MIYNLDNNWLESKKYSIQEVKDIDSKEFIKNFLAKPKFFTNVEMVMQATYVACTGGVKKTMKIRILAQ